jgi:hypothetical protein
LESLLQLYVAQTKHPNVAVQQFFYRTNPDESIGSICGRCYQTVAIANHEESRHLSEERHIHDLLDVDGVKPTLRSAATQYNDIS